ncbi:ABC transporter ATP-binding protein [Pusillimonas sp. CC-YST705]|uniref:ABC transporter ATP-binding protein n=1 Tax=Mesopusillimonas faecipullorum TaxID=2755040 RepID=A0ABS8C9G7_9BURK|nr:ABC transporter ATP-binding protein [Mesopusillimonas faecipullorum]MCB5362479.1 ABC transporter ATP-binding protein [Mesopusillimonas faecipullorum]
MTHPVLQFSGVQVVAHVGKQEVALLRQVDFAVGKGRTLGLVGESGAGKSMIGRVVAGLLPSNLRFAAGEVLFQGERLTSAAARGYLGKRIAFIPQEPLSALNPVLTIGQQMLEHLKRVGVVRAERNQYAQARLAEVGLPEPAQILSRYPHQLSGGQCQRVLIAMAFSGDPELIIADEPTTALDVVTQVQIIHLLRHIQQKYETAVILITHDLRMAAHVCDDVAVLYAGDVVETGPARLVLEQPRHPYSWALKQATPSLHGNLHELPVLPDLMPGLRDMVELRGCRFAPRCSTRNVECESHVHPLEAVGEGHYIRCASACRIQENVQTEVLPQRSSTGVSGASALLELHQASMRYTIRRADGKKAYFDALKPLDLSIRPGELVGVVGESGSGKSTLARIMAGLVQPTGGEVRVSGIARQRASTQQLEHMRQTVQMVFQDPDSALNPRRTVESLMTQVLEVQASITAKARREQALRLVGQVGMAPDALQRFSSQLSGGQKQRVNIARALCAAPQLLIADEIVSGLDVSVQALIMNLLLRLNRELGIAVVLISHDLSVIRYLCQRVLVMYRGSVVEQGETDTVFSNPQHPYTRVLLSSVPPDDARANWPPAQGSLEAQMALAESER